MEIEHEAKVLEVDPEAVAAAIVALGGVDHGEVLQHRYVYGTCPPVEGKWSGCVRPAAGPRSRSSTSDTTVSTGPMRSRSKWATSNPRPQYSKPQDSRPTSTRKPSRVLHARRGKSTRGR